MNIKEEILWGNVLKWKQVKMAGEKEANDRNY